MSSTVVGIFEYTSEAQEAQKYLIANGFSSDNVDIKVSSTGTISDTTEPYTGDSSTLDTTETYKTDNSIFNTTEPYRKEDSSDGIGGFFRHLFGDDDDEVTRYSEAGRKGTIVTVHARTADEAEAAARILDNFGAVDVNENSSKAINSSYSSADSSYVPDTSDVVNPALDSTSIPIIEEELQVGKREVQTGGVRLKSRIVERPVEESIRLRQEFVNVERTTVNRVATDADFDTFKEGTIEIIEHAEVPVVSKEARVVEEVSFGKEVTEREEVISDTVRRTEVETEDISDTDSTIRRTDSDKYHDL